MKIIIAAFLILLLNACATSPDKIDSAYVSPLKYQTYDCSQIGQEMDYVGQRTTKLYQSLKKESDNDNLQMGIGLILFWPALFFLEGGDGPGVAEYAQLKGEFEALRKSSITKKCLLDYKTPEEIIKEKEATKEAQQTKRNRTTGPR